ncbi:hypothetical protein N7451_000480 [Penicillium sp. IBT 35674x]|nr:hypothetical protein N7451_000480 [Penicillium sp. IBT 35674x]
MARIPNFCTAHIDFDDHGRGLSESESVRKKLTFSAASAVSLLCYEDSDNVVAALEQNSAYKVARSHDLVSAIWCINEPPDTPRVASQHRNHRSTPLLAWSVRLQTAFIGFRGTNAIQDVLTDLDVRPAAGITGGTRFHKGFYDSAIPYGPLVAELAQRFRVVICGHSMGGALATIVGYHVLTDSRVASNPVQDAWEEAGSQGISIVTFGAPSMMVAETSGTTAVPRKKLSRLFHHIFNADDPVPFIVNATVTKLKRWLLSAGDLVRDQKSHLRLVCDVLTQAFDLWYKGQGQFAHYGCMYQILQEEGSNQEITCNAVTSTRVFLMPTEETTMGNFIHHSMSHYNYCFGIIIKEGGTPDVVIDAAAIDCKSFADQCLPLSQLRRACTGVIYEDRIVIMATFTSPLIPFLVDKAIFRMDNKDIQFPLVTYSKISGQNEITMQMEQPMGIKEKPQAFLKTADAIQKDLKLRDSFHRLIRLKLDEMKHVSLRDIVHSTTFESVRLALIIALVRQSSKALALRRQTSVSEAVRQEAGALTQEASQIAECIDWIITNASPHLVVTNLTHAFALVEGIWGEQSSEDEESQPLDIDFPLPQHAAYLPTGCTGHLRTLLLEMLFAIADSCPLHLCTERDWRNAGIRRMIDAYPRVPTLEATLSQAGRELYGRPSDPQQRIQEAIRHSSEVLSAMRFCHLLVLTQLDAPSEWIIALKEDKRWMSSAISFIPSLSSSAVTLGIGGSLVLSEAIYRTGMGDALLLPVYGVALAAGARTWTAVHPKVNAWLSREHKIDLGFQLHLVKSLELLGLPKSRFDCITENTISEYVRKRKHTADTLKLVLVKGLASIPGIPKSWHYEMGRVRSILSRRLYVGVEGTTAAGKSELLTVLTAAPETAFSSGAHLNSRTMDIQMYETEDLSAAYLDCPGCDDQDIQIRDVAALVRDILNVIIFVIPCTEMRSVRTQSFLREIGRFLVTRTDPRPVRILLNKVDLVTFRRHQISEFEVAVSQAKRHALELIRKDCGLELDSPIPSRRAVSHPGGFNVVLSTETLEDIVQPFSTHAQMSYDRVKALSDCDRDEVPMITDRSKFQHLYQMAQDGRIWDIESLREWLRNLSPLSVPDSGRVAPG